MAGMESGEAERMHRASPDSAANSKSGGARAQTASQDSGASIGGGGESSLVSAGAPSTVLSVPGRRLNATGPGLGFLPDTLIMAGNDTSGVINILCAACAPPRGVAGSLLAPSPARNSAVMWASPQHPWVAAALSQLFYALLPCHKSSCCPSAPRCQPASRAANSWSSPAVRRSSSSFNGQQRSAVLCAERSLTDPPDANETILASAGLTSIGGNGVDAGSVIKLSPLTLYFSALNYSTPQQLTVTRSAPQTCSACALRACR